MILNKKEKILLKEYITDDWKWLTYNGEIIDEGHILNIRETIPYLLDLLGYDATWEQTESVFIPEKENDGN